MIRSFKIVFNDFKIYKNVLTNIKYSLVKFIHINLSSCIYFVDSLIPIYKLILVLLFRVIYLWVFVFKCLLLFCFINWLC